MSRDVLRKYINIINESAELAEMTRMSKAEADYVSQSTGRDRCANCKHFVKPNACRIVEGMISPGGWCSHYSNQSIEEKWGTETTVSPSEKGKYKGRSLEELRKSYAALKKSGPHKKGSAEYGRMRELAFAIRAKTGWGGVQ